MFYFFEMLSPILVALGEFGPTACDEQPGGSLAHRVSLENRRSTPTQFGSCEMYSAALGSGTLANAIDSTQLATQMLASGAESSGWKCLWTVRA
jgi:hypothetical protein